MIDSQAALIFSSLIYKDIQAYLASHRVDYEEWESKQQQIQSKDMDEPDDK